jgi:hypothetical protein
MEHIQTRVVSMCKHSAPEEETLLRPGGTPRYSKNFDPAAEAEETRSVSTASLHGGAMQKTPTKLNGAGVPQGLEGMEQVPQGAFIIPAGAVVMMPAGSHVQYVNNRGASASEPERERTPEFGENRIAL